MSSSNTSTAPASQPAGKRGVIDQFEGDLATIVFDDNEQLVVARSLLPANARSGDVVMVHACLLPAAADAAAQSFSVESSTAPTDRSPGRRYSRQPAARPQPARRYLSSSNAWLTRSCTERWPYAPLP